MRLLVIEDEAKLAGLLERGLAEEGYAVDVAADVASARWFVAENDYDGIVLDVMLPDGSGFELIGGLRDEGCQSPVLMLTARDSVTDRVRGLDSGADDYLTKPFSFAELLARMRSITRRQVTDRSTVLRVGDLTLDPSAHRVLHGRTEISLTRKEFALLEYFMLHPGEVLSRTRLIAHVWDFAFESDSNVVDVYVRYLRKKIDHPFGTDSIETLRGVGYRLRSDRDDAPAH